VSRLFVASLGMDACECASCQGRWDEEHASGAYRGRSERESILVHH
jgi:hypothetical protein